jgi:hypothetical protein
LIRTEAKQPRNQPAQAVNKQISQSSKAQTVKQNQPGTEMSEGRSNSAELSGRIYAITT